MDNVTKILLLAVGLIVTVAGIAYGMNIFNSSDDAAKKGQQQLNAQLSGLSDMDKTLYDGTVMSGTDVIQAIQKFNGDHSVYVIVSTKGSEDGDLVAWNVVYDGDLAVAGAGGTDESELLSLYCESQVVSGWPAKDACGNVISDFSSFEAALPKISKVTALASGEDSSSGTAVSGSSGTAVSGSSGTDEIPVYAEAAGYDSTLTTQEFGYISTSAQFDSSVQKNQNGEVKFITFIQR